MSTAIRQYTLNTDLAVSALGLEADEQRSWRDSERFHKILAWLYSGDFAQCHMHIREKRKKGTGTWLLESAEFISWKEGRGHRLLWGMGIREWSQPRILVGIF